VTDAPWLLKPGIFGPNNRMVDFNSDFKLHCMIPDSWRALDTHWYIYFTLTSIYCHLYPTNTSRFSCSQPHDMSRFSVYYARYVMVLHVKGAKINDTGLYTCSRPAYFYNRKPMGHVAHVGIIREFVHEITEFCTLYLSCNIVTPKFPKGGSKRKFAVFWRIKFNFCRINSATKFVCENFQQQLCSKIIPLFNGLYIKSTNIWQSCERIISLRFFWLTE